MSGVIQSSGEFSWRIRVYWEDTDAGGVVYHAGYVRFMERARSEWLRARGIDQVALRETRGCVFVVRDLQLDFLSPARLDDELDVTVEIEKRRRASLSFGQTIRRAGTADILSQGKVRVACVDVARMRPIPMPEPITTRID